MADPQALRLVHTKDGTGSAGYALVPRHVMTLPVFRNEAEALAFVGMILRASWRDQRVRYKGHVLALQRGQLAVSIRDFARALDRDKGWVERLWKHLKSEALIETRSEAGVSIITICNYDEYQQSERFPKADDETLREAGGETVARQLRDTEQLRETIGTKEIGGSVIPLPTPAKRGRRAAKKVPLPPDWQPTIAGELGQLIADWSPERIQREVMRFRNHAAAGGRVFADPNAAFRNWVMNRNEWDDSNSQKGRNNGQYKGRSTSGSSIVDLNVDLYRSLTGK